MTKRLFTAMAALLWVSSARADAAVKDQLRVEAQSSLRTMEGNAQRVQRALGSARGRATLAEVRCLDASLSRADASVRAGREDVRLTLVALDADDLGEARRHTRLLATQREASRAAMVDADSCTGSPALPSERTSVRVTMDPSLPTDGAVFAGR